MNKSILACIAVTMLSACVASTEPPILSLESEAKLQNSIALSAAESLSFGLNIAELALVTPGEISAEITGPYSAFPNITNYCVRLSNGTFLGKPSYKHVLIKQLDTDRIAGLLKFSSVFNVAGDLPLGCMTSSMRPFPELISAYKAAQGKKWSQKNPEKQEYGTNK